MRKDTEFSSSCHVLVNRTNCDNLNEYTFFMISDARHIIVVCFSQNFRIANIYSKKEITVKTPCLARGFYLRLFASILLLFLRPPVTG